MGLLRIACVGDATAKAVTELHLKVECQPKKATAEALADEMVATGSMDSAKVLVVNADSIVPQRCLDLLDRLQKLAHQMLE